MKVLFVCHRFPYPPNEGGKIRAFNMIRHLQRSGHQVTVASPVRTREELQQGIGLAEYCAGYVTHEISAAGAALRMGLYLAAQTPSSFGYFYSHRLQKDINSLIARHEFDLIVVHCSSAAQYVEHVRGIPMLLDFCDMDSQKWLAYAKFKSFPGSLGYHLEGRKLQRRETRQANMFDICTCATPFEWQTLQGLTGAVSGGWFPNGVDADYFAASDDASVHEEICFVGRMDYYPNEQAVIGFCREVLPLVRAQRPHVKFIIVGAKPSARVTALGTHDGVEVTGTVPDVRPYVRRAALTVAPLQIARGTQNKILESMAMTTPVVASAQAAGGVDARSGDGLLIANDPAGYRDAVLSILEDAELRQRLGASGRQRVLTNHSWRHAMEKLDALIEECMRTSHWTQTSVGQHQ